MSGTEATRSSSGAAAATATKAQTTSDLANIIYY
jgi:hypothetical protein